MPCQRLKADVIGCFDVGEGVEERTKEDSEVGSQVSGRIIPYRDRVRRGKWLEEKMLICGAHTTLQLMWWVWLEMA